VEKEKLSGCVGVSRREVANERVEKSNGANLFSGREIKCEDKQ